MAWHISSFASKVCSTWFRGTSRRGNDKVEWVGEKESEKEHFGTWNRGVELGERFAW